MRVDARPEHHRCFSPRRERLQGGVAAVLVLLHTSGPRPYAVRDIEETPETSATKPASRAYRCIERRQVHRRDIAHKKLIIDLVNSRMTHFLA